MNERYQKYTGPKGRTRKSAAAAKPARKGAKGGSSSAKSRAGSRPKAPVRRRQHEPTTSEYKQWRRWWWVALLSGMAFVTISLVIQYVFHSAGVLRIVGYVTLAFAYAALIAAFFIDYRKLRPLRQGRPLPSRKKKDSSGGKHEENSDADSTEDA